MDSSIARPLGAEEKTRALAAARSLGYELQVTQASVTRAANRLDVSVSITNRGVAPFYANWPVQLRAVNARGGESNSPLPFDLAKLLPGENQTQKSALDVSKLTGEITLHISVPSPLKGGKPLRFANVGHDDQGWLILGQIPTP